MRGKGMDEAFANGTIRITPAHAGKRYVEERLGIGKTDHPRPCGEKLTCRQVSAVILGSPPPMRGKAVVTVDAQRLERITPAHAGKRR